MITYKPKIFRFGHYDPEFVDFGSLIFPVKLMLSQHQLQHIADRIGRSALFQQVNPDSTMSNLNDDPSTSLSVT